MSAFAVIDVKEFLAYSAEGTLDLALGYKLWEALLDEYEDLCCHVIIDCRGVRKSTSYQDIYELMSYAAEQPRLKKYTLALLGKLRDDFEFSQFAEFVGQLKGLCIRAFINEDKARAWLASTTAKAGSCIDS